MPGAQLATLQTLAVQDLRKLNFPGPTDPEDTWNVTTAQGQGWIDRYSGQMLAWQDATLAQRVYDWAVVLHTGEAAWPWAVVLGLVGASVLLFWLSGVVIWWQARRQAPHITGNTPLAQADVLIFVASEGGSTWGFAQTLQDALSQGGHRVHTSALENFRTTPATRQVFVLAATDKIRLVLAAIHNIDKPVQRVMIAGGGKVGLRLARSLVGQCEVKILERDKKRCEYLASQLPSRMLILQGDGSDEDLLLEENVGEMDMFLALTSDDEDNIMSSMLAKRLGANRVMALINRRAYADMMQGSTIDIAISPSQTVIGELLTHLRRGDVAAVHSLRRGVAEALEGIARKDTCLGSATHGC